MTEFCPDHWKDMQCEKRLKEESIEPPEVTKIQQIIRKNTLKQTNATHFGSRLFPDREVSIEIPKLLVASRQGCGEVVKPLKQILHDFNKGVVHFTGPAGSGKTTLLKEISRKVYDKEYEGLRSVDIVLFLKCCDFNTSKQTTPSKLLLSFLEPDLEKPGIDVFEKILAKTPERVLIVLDGLDTFPDYYYKDKLKISEKKVTDTDKMMKVYQIIIHLLNGRLYSGCRIITSARDMNLGRLAVVDYHARVHLLGLQDGSIYNIGQKLLGNSVVAYEMMDVLDAHPHLKDICRTPMFLISFLRDYLSNGKFSYQHSVTDNLLFLVKHFISTQKRLEEVTDVKNLKQLAFDLRKKNMINFTLQALSDHHLMIDRIDSLVFCSPNGHNRVYFFVHQFIHEILVALHLAGLEVRSFRREVTECMKSPWFSFSILMMCRMVCNVQTYQLAKIYGLLEEDPSLTEKREILLKLCQEMMSRIGTKDSSPEKVLFTLLTLNECGDSATSLISKKLHEINLDFEHLGTLWVCDTSALMAVAKKTTKLDMLSLRRSWIQHTHLKVMSAVIGETPFNIRKLDLSGNILYHEAMADVGRIAEKGKIEELDISECAGLLGDDPEKILSSLKIFLERHKLKVLNISYMTKSLNEKEMTVDEERSTQHLIYELQEEPNSEQLLPHRITCKYPIWGEWSRASYDFVRALSALVPNVSEKIIVHGWKFSEEDKQLMVSSLSMNLRIQLSDGNELRRTAVKDMRKYHPGQSRVVAYSNKLKWLDSKLPPQIKSIPQTPEITKLAEMKSSQTFDKPTSKLQLDLDSKPRFTKIEIAHRPLTVEDIDATIEELATKKELHELELRDCGLNEDHLKMLLKGIVDINQGIKITKLSITAAENIEELIPTICKLMAKASSTELNIEESIGSGSCLAALAKNIRDNKVTLLKLDLSYRDENDYKEARDIFSCELTELNLVECNLRIEDFENLKNKESKINRFDVSYNCDIDEEFVQMLPAILCKDEPLSISMVGCDLTVHELKGFQDSSMKIKKLRLDHNSSMECDGIEEVGCIARKHSTKTISLSSCGLKEDSLDYFMSGLKEHQLQRLNLSRNVGIASCPEKIAALMKKSGVVDVDLSNCHFVSSQIQSLADSMSKYCVKVEILDLSDDERRTLDPKYIQAIQQILLCTKCCLKLHLPNLCEDEKKIFKKLRS